MASFSLIMCTSMGVVNTSNSCVKIELWSKRKMVHKTETKIRHILTKTLMQFTENKCRNLDFEAECNSNSNVGYV
jgi:hypothetical protein